MVRSNSGLLSQAIATCMMHRIAVFQVAKCLTMLLAIYLAKEVAAILRAVLTHDAKKLYDEGTVRLLCSIDPAVA